MTAYLLLSIIVCLAAAFSYINYKLVKFPYQIGLFFLATLLAIGIYIGGKFNPEILSKSREYIDILQIDKLVLDVILALLLFAGAMHTKWSDLREQWKEITIYALGGVLLTTFLIGTFMYYVCQWCGMPLSYIYCLVFGALSSPTDPIAVLGILTKANVPKRMESIIVGESLFNDGVGIVCFLSVLASLDTGQLDAGLFGKLFVQESIGGIGMGLFLGYIMHKIMMTLDDYVTEVMITFAFVMGGYALINWMHMSGALAMVVMGLMAGNYQNQAAMSGVAKEYIHKFWELIDAIFNAVLFIVIGLFLLDLDFNKTYVIIGALSVAVIILSRLIVVYLPKLLMPKVMNLSVKQANLLVWGGLRGALSLAMALSLPESEIKNLLVLATYFSVLFSILVQGLTVERVARNV